MVKKDSSAVATEFGFHFQTDAGIAIMLEYLNNKDFQELKMEGLEDIELRFNDGSVILAQAKSAIDPEYNYSNNTTKLHKALQTLSAGGAKAKAVRKYILVTNYPNQFSNIAPQQNFYSYDTLDYDDLKVENQQSLKEYIKKLTHKDILKEAFNQNKFSVVFLPFKGNDLIKRKRALRNLLDDWYGDLNVDIEGVVAKICRIWQENIFENNTVFENHEMIYKGKKIKHPQNKNRSLKKKDIVWPVIVLLVDRMRRSDSFYDNYLDGDYDYLMDEYHDIIKITTERFRFITKVLSDFSSYENNIQSMSRKRRKRKYLDNEFIEHNWKDYVKLFGLNAIYDQDDQEDLTKIILHQIILNRRDIDKVKKRVGL